MSEAMQNNGSLNTEDFEKVLYNFNQTQADEYLEQTIIERFESQVKEMPEQIAVSLDGRKLSYKELNEKANQVGWILRKQGVQPNDIVAIISEKSIEMIVGIIGILKSGGAYMPLDPSYPKERIEFYLKDSGTKHLLTALKDTSIINDIQNGVQLYNLYECIEDTLNLPIVNKRDDLAYIIYTSGTTGVPKGVMIENKGVLNMAKFQRDNCQMCKGVRMLQVANYVFDASVLEVFSTLLNGGYLEIVTEDCRINPDKLLELFPESQMLLIPSLFRIILGHAVLHNKTDLLNSFDKIYLGAEEVTMDLLKEYRKVSGNKIFDIFNYYGPTEATVFATTFRYSEDQCNSFPIGKGIYNCKLYIINNGQLCNIGQPGELCITGVGLFRGYLNNPELTAEKLTDNPYLLGEKMYHTGDLVQWREDGNIDFLGRIDEQIKIRGFRIELGEITKNIQEIPWVKEVAVIARKKENGTYICAYVVTDHDINEIKPILLEKIPEYMIPAAFVQMKSLPLTSSGKLNKKELPEPLINYTDENVIITINQTEQMILDICKKVLAVNEIIIGRKFIELGGDSIKAIQLVSLLENKGFHVEIKDILGSEPFDYIIQKVADSNVKIEKDGGVLEFTNMQMQLLNNHYGLGLQYKLLAYSQKINVDYVKQTLEEMIKHHDIFRSKITSSNISIAKQFEEKWCDFTTFDFSSIQQDEVVRKINDMKIIQGMAKDVYKAPQLKVALFLGEQKDYLLLGISDLLLDKESWEIMIDDFEYAYQLISKGNKVLWQEKLISYVNWNNKISQREKEYFSDDSKYYEDEIATTLDYTKQELISLPVMQSVKLECNEKDTNLLLHYVTNNLEANIEEVLFTAVAMSSKNTLNNYELAFNFNKSDRKVETEDIDYSRTLGQFTVSYPIICDEIGDEIETNINIIKNKVKDVSTKKLLNPKKLVNKGASLYFSYYGEKSNCNQTSLFNETEYDLSPLVSYGNHELRFFNDYDMLNVIHTEKEEEKILLEENFIYKFERMSKQNSKRIFGYYENEIYTYGDISEESNRIANFIKKRKKSLEQTRIGVCISHPFKRLIVKLAILKAGEIAITINTDLSYEKTKEICLLSKTSFAFIQEENIGMFNKLEWEIKGFNGYLCMDSIDVHLANEKIQNVLMNKNIWEFVANEASDDEILGGGWKNSYTGELFSKEEMLEYRENTFKKLEKYLEKDKRILEIGCASGITMYRVAPYVSYYHGIDLSETIIQKNKAKIRDEHIDNIEVETLQAHELDQVNENEFDIVILNSVVQCFNGYNYLREVLLKIISKMKNKGIIYLGDLMDQDKKEEFILSLKDADANSGKVKIDWSNELFISKNFLNDLMCEFKQIQKIEFTDKIYTIKNELTSFRYDAMVFIDKSADNNCINQKVKEQYSLKDLNEVKDLNYEFTNNSDKAAIIFYDSKQKEIKITSNFFQNICKECSKEFLINEGTNMMKCSDPQYGEVDLEVLVALYMGAKVYIIDQSQSFDNRILDAYIKENNISVCYLSKNLYNQFMQYSPIHVGMQMVNQRLETEIIFNSAQFDYNHISNFCIDLSEQLNEIAHNQYKFINENLNPSICTYIWKKYHLICNMKKIRTLKGTYRILYLTNLTKDLRHIIQKDLWSSFDIHVLPDYILDIAAFDLCFNRMDDSELKTICEKYSMESKEDKRVVTLSDFDRNVEGTVIDQIMPADIQYIFLPFPIILNEKFSVLAKSEVELLDAIREIVKEQDVLRTTVQCANEKFMLEVHEYTSYDIPVFDCKYDTSEIIQGALGGILFNPAVFEEYQSHILSRIIVLKLSETMYEIHIQAHHSIWDMKSTLIFKEKVEKRLAKIPDTDGNTVQYKDYAIEANTNFMEHPESYAAMKLMDFRKCVDELSAKVPPIDNNLKYSKTALLELGPKALKLYKENTWEVILHLVYVVGKENRLIDDTIQDLPVLVIQEDRNYMKKDYQNTMGLFIDLLPMIYSYSDNFKDSTIEQQIAEVLKMKNDEHVKYFMQMLMSNCMATNILGVNYISTYGLSFDDVKKMAYDENPDPSMQITISDYSNYIILAYPICEKCTSDITKALEQELQRIEKIV